MALKVEIVDRRGLMWSGQADYVAVPSAEGDLGVLPGRQPALVVLRTGEVRVNPVDKSDIVSFQVEKGFASIDNDAVTVVVERDLSSNQA